MAMFPQRTNWVIAAISTSACVAPRAHGGLARFGDRDCAEASEAKRARRTTTSFLAMNSAYVASGEVLPDADIRTEQ
jgi:hypothetical protein